MIVILDSGSVLDRFQNFGFWILCLTHHAFGGVTATALAVVAASVLVGPEAHGQHRTGSIGACWPTKATEGN